MNQNTTSHIAPSCISNTGNSLTRILSLTPAEFSRRKQRQRQPQPRRNLSSHRPPPRWMQSAEALVDDPTLYDVTVDTLAKIRVSGDLPIPDGE